MTVEEMGDVSRAWCRDVGADGSVTGRSPIKRARTRSPAARLHTRAFLFMRGSTCEARLRPEAPRHLSYYRAEVLLKNLALLLMMIAGVNPDQSERPPTDAADAPRRTAGRSIEALHYKAAERSPRQP